MDNFDTRPCASSGDTCFGTGYISQKIENPKHVHSETHVDKSTTNIQYFYTFSGLEGTTSKRLIGSCCKDIDEEGHKLCDVFKHRLQFHYRQLVVPKLAWLNGGFDLSIADHFIQLQLDESQKPINIDEVFDKTKDEQPRRILIEGQPGFGKTTLATKLAYDWAIGKKYINFKFALFLPLGELLQQKSFQAAIEEIGKRCDCNNAAQIILSHKKSILFILDGLDEMPQEERLEIMKILYKQVYSDATVVVFCRSGVFALSNEESKQLFGLTKIRDDFSDKRISILGVANEENKREFLEKFILEDDVNEIIKRLASRWELFDSPLLLMLLSVILQEGENIEQFSSQTEFYKRLFNCMVRHNYIKHGWKIDSHFDLFCLKSSPNKIQESLRRFGMLAAHKIVSNNLKFDGDDLTKEIYEMGFLVNKKEMTFVKSTNHYQALHLTIIEFAVAFAFWMDLKSKTPTSKSDLKIIVNYFFRTRGTSLIMPFLASLMEDDLDHLLSLIDPYSPWFSFFYHLPGILFAECSSIDISNSKFLKNFIPFLSENQMRIMKEIIKCGTECNKIKLILIDEKTKSVILTSGISTHLQLTFQLNSTVELEVLTRGSSVYPIPFKGPLNECLHFAASLNWEECFLSLDSFSDSSEFLDLLSKENSFCKIKYFFLKIRIRTEVELQVVMKLLENNQVEYLELKLDPNFPLDMEELSRAAARSTYLTWIEFCNAIIDLYELTDGGTKKYKVMRFENCTVTCRRPLLTRNCCHRLEIHNVGNLEGIVEMEPTVFDCVFDVVKDFVNDYPTWTGFSSVKTLKTYYNYNVKSFINLQTLYLYVNKSSTCLDDLANCIQALPIVNLVIDNFSFDVSNLFKRLNLWKSKNSSQLKTISLYENESDNELSQACELLDGLFRRHWDTVNLLTPGRYKDLDKLIEYVSDLNLLITFNKYESIYFEPDPVFKFFYVFYPGCETILSLTRKSQNKRCLMS